MLFGSEMRDMSFNYTVEAGDTLWILAQKFKTTVDAIRTLNSLTSDMLNIGQTLMIPSNVQRNLEFQFGTWIPSIQIGNGIIQGQYIDRVGNWTRIGQQIFVNAFFQLNYNQTQVEDAIRRNTTVQEIRIGTLPFESNSGASIFNLMVSNNHFIENGRMRYSQAWDTYIETEVLSVGARSIWGSPRMRVFANERDISGRLNDRMPIGIDLSVQDLRPSTQGVSVEVRLSGTYTAFPDLAVTDPVNTPPPNIIESIQLA
ncbi:MAG: LysM peptidoglycan-binding domain-containing protein [Oscillospiraceae bacterium]|nr:LysM peptidoglycan-binding domain-containing protein [Oscillospiraceae bacterium]